MFRCKCGVTYADPLQAAECEQQGHKPTSDPMARAEATRAAEVTAAENMITVVMGTPSTPLHRSYTISEAALLMRSLSDQTLLIAVRRIVATPCGPQAEPVPFRDLLNELATRLDKALMELASRAE